MLTAKNDAQEFDFRTPTRWRICFFLMSMLPLTLGVALWANFLGTERAGDFWPCLTLFALTALPLFLCFYILYFSLRTVRFHCAHGSVFETTRFLGISKTRIFDPDRITLKRASFGHRNPQIWLAIYRHQGERQSLLVNEQSCDAIRDLYAWLEKKGQFPCMDKSGDSFGG